MTRRELPYKQIGKQELTANRSDKQVSIAPRGVLNDYVPFYFCSRSVMLYQIHTGRVPTYTEGQEPVIHLVSSVETIINAKLPYVFTDSHAKTNMATQYNNVTDLDQIDWEVIQSHDFKNRDDQPDRTQRKMAEFLVHSFVPWACIEVVGVYSQRWKDDCERLLNHYRCSAKVMLRTGWYF